MKINKVAILGAGAVGSYLVWGLSKKNIELCLVASGERKLRLEKEGLYINGEQYRPVVKSPLEAQGADLLIVALKYNALRDALPSIREICDEHTMVMSLMNGVDSEDIIAEVIPKEQILYSLIKIASERKENSIVFNPETTIGITIGEDNQDRGTERIEAISNLLNDTGIHFNVSHRILTEIWAKFRLNIEKNLPQAILGVGVGAYTDSEHVAFLQLKLREEVEKIALAKGVDLSVLPPISGVGSRVKPRNRYSTLQDLDAKRKTEIDMFSGAVIAMGKELGIPTPYNEFTYHAIKALEEKNEGLFDYE